MKHFFLYLSLSSVSSSQCLHILSLELFSTFIDLVRSFSNSYECVQAISVWPLRVTFRKSMSCPSGDLKIYLKIWWLNMLKYSHLQITCIPALIVHKRKGSFHLSSVSCHFRHTYGLWRYTICCPWACACAWYIGSWQEKTNVHYWTDLCYQVKEPLFTFPLWIKFAAE